MIDKRPAAIAYCTDEADVAAALRYGVEHGLRIAVRGGGHNGGGLGSVDDGLVIDLSQMNAIEVDARREDGARRRRRAAEGRARGDAPARADRPRRDHRHHGRRRAHARRRHGTSDAGMGLTIDNLVGGDGRPRRRLGRPDRRGARAGSLLGAARWRWQLRRRHVVLVPLPSRSPPSSRGRCSTTSTTPPSS